jgi:DNA-binding NtrC family response regulator
VPPLRERREDIPLLVEKFAGDAAAALGRSAPRHFEGFISALSDWSFPGNVRELFALVNGAMSWAEGETLPPSFAAEYLRSQKMNVPERGKRSPSVTEESAAGDRFPTLEEVMDRHIEAALLRCKGNQSLAARLLGISQSTISRKLLKKA